MKIPSMASKIIKIFSVIMAGMALYGVVGFYLLPALLTAKVPDIIQQQTGRKATISKIAFNPFNLRCRLYQFKMLEKNGQPFVSFENFATKINLWQSIKQRALAIEEVALSKPYVHVARLKNDDFNFADIAKSKAEQKKSDGSLFPVSISKIAIIDGQVFWEDHHADKSVQEKITPINLDIEHFTTHADQQSKLGITLALLSGGKLQWKGKIGVNPITSQGHINLDNINLATLLALASPNKPAFTLQGYERFSADYQLDFIKDKLKLTLDKSQLQLHNVQFANKDPNPLVIKIPELTLATDCTVQQAKNNFTLNANKFKLAIQDFVLEKPGQNGMLLKLLDMTHETQLTVSLVDKALHLTANKDKLDLRELYMEQKGNNGRVIKVPALVHQADITLDKKDNTLQIAANKAKLDVRDIDIQEQGDSSRHIEIPVITHETDITLQQTDKELQLATDKSKLTMRDFRLKEDGINSRTITLPSMSHETDLKFSQTDKGLQINANKAVLSVSDLDFKDRGQTKVAVKIPNFNHETDLQFNLADKVWQVVVNKSKINSRNIQLTGMDIAPIFLKIPELALEAAYKTDNKNDTVNFIASKGKFDVHKLQLDDTEHKTTLAKINAFALTGFGINLKDQELSAESVTGQNADFKAWLNKDKTLNYQTLFASPKPHAERRTTKTVAIGKKTTSKPWKIKVGLLALSDFGLDFEDRTLVKPVAMSARPINLKIKNYSNKIGASLPIQLNMGINKTGSIKVNGHSTLEPFASQLSLAVNNIDLEKFQPYVDKFAKLDIIDGNWNLDGKVAIAKKADAMDVKFKGSTSVAQLITRDQMQNKDFVKWENLSLNKIDADVLANRYTVATLLIDKPYAKITIRKDKTINVNDIIIRDNKAPTTVAKSDVAKSTPSAGKRPYFKLDTVKIIDGASDFSDLSLILPFSAPIRGLNGGASGISSVQNSKISIDLEGNTFELSPVKIKGSVSPYLGDFNVDMNFNGMPMPLVSPYMVQFAGYKVEKGKLTLGLHYMVEKKQLTASNNILIDQLELGEKVENPNAVSLPLELAITLLKDSDGKIKIDVPLTGSLEDPKFSIGAVLGDALVNILTKIVTAPFNAIAGLMGSDEDLSVVNFAAGTDVLTPEQTGKLDDVGKALKERPTLNIDIKGAAFQEQDWPALRKDALRDQLKRLKANEINKDNVKKIRAEYVELSDEDYNDLLADVFIQQFPKQAKKSIFGTPKLTDPAAGDFYSVAQKKLAESIAPDQKRLKDLATDRAEAIAKYLVQKAGIPNERVFILDTVVDPERDNKDITSQLSLKTN